MKNRVQMNIRIPIDIRDWAKQMAENNHRSLASFITVVLEELKEKEKMQDKY